MRAELLPTKVCKLIEEVADPFYNLPQTPSPKGSLRPSRLKGSEGGAPPPSITNHQLLGSPTEPPPSPQRSSLSSEDGKIKCDVMMSCDPEQEVCECL